MGKHRALKIAVATLLLSSPVWAESGNHGIDQAGEPIVIEGNNHSTMEAQQQHIRITTRERQTGHHHHHRLSINYPHTVHPMMTIGHHQTGQNQHLSAMDGENGDMMKPQTMQTYQQHMANMEQRLANIEALLEKLLEMQKP